MMVIELVEGDESRVRWNYGEGWHYADLDDLIRVYESVVRCKDCKYADEYGMCGRVAWYNKKDDYCSRGERKEDGLLVTDKD